METASVNQRDGYQTGYQRLGIVTKL